MHLLDFKRNHISEAMKTFQTQYGELVGVANYKTDADGRLLTCILNRENRIATPVGELIPQYREAEFGERQKKYRSSIDFHKNGNLKSVALDKAMPIKTPIGTYTAELVTFHEDGSLNRLFPLNGKIDGYWSEKNERELAPATRFVLPIAEFTAKAIGMSFYQSGELRSLTLWPGEKIKLETPAGTIRVGTGFSLYEDGNLKSVEPARPTKLQTPIGEILAFDTEVIGMHADQNSIRFGADGSLLSLKTVNTGIHYKSTDGQEGVIEPVEAPSLIDINDTRTIPMLVEFFDTETRVSTPETKVFPHAAYTLSAFRRAVVISSGCGSCSGCSSAPEERSANGGDACCTKCSS